MWTYQAPLAEINFVLNRWLQVGEDWQQIPAFRDLDIDTVQQLLTEAERFAVETLLPANLAGDMEGCHLDNGKVTTPKGYIAAWQEFVDAGWPALSCAPEWQGQGLPQLVSAIAYEMFYACGHAWAMYPSLAHGAYECLRQFGSDELKNTYLTKLVSGEWMATMCLTESQAGSDVGLLRTRAEPQADGTYRITGNKIFISGGEHDLTSNIVHLVLARLPDSPPGSRGISLFVVPKFIGTTRNGVSCTGIEKKMGIKGSATCSMSFDNAHGWIVGAPNKGLAAMFVMMNAARLHVGLQGMAHAEISMQNALSYARERRQMRAAIRPDPGSVADLILLHPPVRRTLLEQRAVVQAQRMLNYWAAHLLDIADMHADAAQRRDAHAMASLLTPILKAVCTETGFTLTSSALQLYGGHGYIHENGIEQALRDSRIATLYEGTTEIQAVDLVMRKIRGDNGATYAALKQVLDAECAAGAAHPDLGTLLTAFAPALVCLDQATQALLQAPADDPEWPLRGARDYQWLIGTVLMGWALLKAARIADAAEDRATRVETAEAFMRFVLPQVNYRWQLMQAAGEWLPQLATE